MEIIKMKDMKGGWFIGDFEPVAYRSDSFEVGYAQHKKGDKWDTHYHKESDEINYMIKGEMLMQGKKITKGDIFILKKYEVADPVFLSDVEVIVVKTPSSKNDKYVVK